MNLKAAGLPNVFSYILIVCLASQIAAQDSEETVPEATEVIEDYIQAIGGELSLRGVETMKLEADLDGLENRADGKVVLNFSEGCWHYDFDLEDGRHTYKRCNDGSVWQSLTAWRKLAKEDQVKFEEIVPAVTGPLRWLEYPGEIEVRGFETVLDRKCVQLEFRPTGGKPVNRFFDVETKLLTRMAYTTGFQTADWYLSDYQEVEGFMVPMQRQQHFDEALSYIVFTQKICINEPVDAEMFIPPKESERQVVNPDDPFADR